MFSRFLASDAIIQPLSQVDDDIPDRLRTANEKVAVGRLFEWLGGVDDCPGNQTALTVVTNAGAAGPQGGTDDLSEFGIPVPGARNDECPACETKRAQREEDAVSL